MKNTVFLVLIWGFLIGCSKDVEVTTTIEVHLRDTDSVGVAGTKVYQMNQENFSIYGMNSNYADQEAVTDALGLVSFNINDSFFNSGSQKPFYFFSKYVLQSSLKSKYKATLASRGTTQRISLILD